MSERTLLAIDIGATAIKSAIYSEGGQEIHPLPTRPTAKTETNNSISQQICELFDEAKQFAMIDGIAIATAGIVDSHNGVIIHAGPTIPNYGGTKLAPIVQNYSQLPCSVENDVNAAALGESWLGAARESKTLLCITVGTGLGAGIVNNGQIFHGYKYNAGEIGFTPSENGERVEVSASTTGLLTHYERLSGEKINGKELFSRFEKGDMHAKKALDFLISRLADTLIPAIYLIAPDTIVVGGGIAEQRNFFAPALTIAIRDKLYSEKFMPREIVCAALGNRAGMIGAIRHFSQRFPDSTKTIT